jgi:hypothetical protein
MHQNRGLGDMPLQNFEHSLLVFGPLPGLVLLEEVMQWSCNFRKPWNPSLIEVDKSDELVNCPYRGQALPIGDDRGLLIIHFKSVPTNIDAQKLDFRLVEFTLLWVAEELGFPKALEGALDTSDVIGEVLVVIQGVVEVVLEVLVEQWSEYLVHVALETGRSIHEAKGHYVESEGAEWSHEGGLLVISRLDV